MKKQLTKVVCVLVGFSVFRASAKDYFPAEMLDHVQGEKVSDLSFLFQDEKVLPGSYLVDFYINGISYGNKEIYFDKNDEHVSGPDNKKESKEAPLIPRFTLAQLAGWGLKESVMASIYSHSYNEYIYPGDVPGVTSHFDFEKMVLRLDIPQADVKHHSKGWVPPETWDDGVNAMFTNYSLSGSQNRGTYGDSDYLYLNLRNGINLGAWRLRNNGYFTHYNNSAGSKGKYTNANTYLKRDIKPLKSEVVVGDATSQGAVFDSFAFRGLMLYTNDAMFPDSERGFAPVIKGTAFSHARITVRQNHNIIYETYVSPGPFEINDVYPFGSSGDLYVTIEEENGTSRQIVVPFSSLPVLQRKGHGKVSFVLGRYRSSSKAYDDPAIFESSAFYGFSDNGTVYGGSQLADKYKAVMLGGGWSLGRAGALSVDLTQASSVLADNSSHQGYSLRFRYSRQINTLGTTLQLAGYRYSTQGFHTFDETALKRMEGWYNDEDDYNASGKKIPRSLINHYNIGDVKKGKIELNISQPLGDNNFVYLSGYRQSYWNSSTHSDSAVFGYSGSWGSLNYNLSASLSRYQGSSSTDKILSASFSIPLASLLGDDSEKNIWATWYMTQDENKKISHSAVLSGTALEQGNLNWSVQQGISDGGKNSGAASLDYRGGYGQVRAGYNYHPDYNQINYGVSGGIVLHNEGVTFAQRLGETNVIISAPGGANIPVFNGNGVHTDWRGYTVVPAGNVYRPMRVTLNTEELDENTEVDKTSMIVVPTEGAFVKAQYGVKNGAHLLLTLLHAGKPLPFGTQVLLNGVENSIVGDSGQAYLSGINNGSVKITAKWGEEIKEQCSVVIDISSSDINNGIVSTLNCD
ncbi:fimbria/pilus outer membrane usher protein [Enterobacter hormaechei]